MRLSDSMLLPDLQPKYAKASQGHLSVDHAQAHGTASVNVPAGTRSIPEGRPRYAWPFVLGLAMPLLSILDCGGTQDR